MVKLYQKLKTKNRLIAQCEDNDNTIQKTLETLGYRAFGMCVTEKVNNSLWVIKPALILESPINILVVRC